MSLFFKMMDYLSASYISLKIYHIVTDSQASTCGKVHAQIKPVVTYSFV